MIPASAKSSQIRKLVKDVAIEIQKGKSNNARLRPGVIISSQLTPAPPTLTIQIAGDLTDISGVRYLESLTVAVGKQVQVWQDGPDIFVIGALKP